jgi:hypothetical protein
MTRIAKTPIAKTRVRMSQLKSEYPPHSWGRQAAVLRLPSALLVVLLCFAAGCSNVASLQKKSAAGDEKSLHKLMEIVSRSDYPYGSRVSAARALGEIGNPAAVPALIGALNSYERRTTFREEAVIALGKIGDRSAVEPIGRLLDRSLGDEYVDLRLTTLPVLSQLGGKKAAEILVAALRYYDILTLQQERKGVRGVFTGEENPWLSGQDSTGMAAQMFGDPRAGGGLGGLGGLGGGNSPVGLFGQEFGQTATARKNFTPEERQLAHQALVGVGEEAVEIIDAQIKTKQTTASLRQELLAIMEEIWLASQPPGE